jgi:hypothetical protein
VRQRPRTRPSRYILSPVLICEIDRVRVVGELELAGLAGGGAPALELRRGMRHHGAVYVECVVCRWATGPSLPEKCPVVLALRRLAPSLRVVLRWTGPAIAIVGVFSQRASEIGVPAGVFCEFAGRLVPEILRTGIWMLLRGHGHQCHFWEATRRKAHGKGHSAYTLFRVKSPIAEFQNLSFL